MHPDLKRHEKVIRALGVDGMSSDESEHEGGSPRYRILQKPWRNPSITSWLRVFDAVHMNARLGLAHGSQRGAMPRVRVASSLMGASRPVVPHLPRNAYSGLWLERLSEYEAASIQPSAGYEFSHSARVAEWVCSTTDSIRLDSAYAGWPMLIALLLPPTPMFRFTINGLGIPTFLGDVCHYTAFVA